MSPNWSRGQEADSTSPIAAPTRRWLGLTATPYRRDGLEGIIAMQCGPTRHETRPGDLPDTALVQRRLIVHPTSFVHDDTASIQEVFGALVEDEERTKQICADLVRALDAGRTCLVLTQRTTHIDAICRQLATAGHDAHILKGGLGKKALAAVHDAIAAPDKDTGIVVVATGSYLGEGFD